MYMILDALRTDPWVGVFILVGLYMVTKTCVTLFATATRERTRREVAAYIAEGSMTPEQGERILAAGNTKGDGEQVVIQV